MQYTWHIKNYKDLSLDLFHDMLGLRVAVFVVEQDCPYQEVDGYDKFADHIAATDEKGEVVACLRVLPAGITRQEISIGRVVVHEAHRSSGLGHELMNKAMHFVKKKYGEASIKISAQEHLSNFYKKHGFLQCGDGYLEDGIPHIPMLSTVTTQKI